MLALRARAMLLLMLRFAAADTPLIRHMLLFA